MKYIDKFLKKLNTYRNTFDIQNGLRKVDFEQENVNITEDVKAIKDWLSIVDIIG